MTCKTILSEKLGYQKEIKLAYIISKWLHNTRKWLHNARKWLRRQKDNSMEFQSVLTSKKEWSQQHANSTPQQTGSTLVTYCTPIILPTKVFHNKISSTILRLWERVAWRQCGRGIMFSLMVLEPRTIQIPLWKINIFTSIIIIIEVYQTW